MMAKPLYFFEFLEKLKSFQLLLNLPQTRSKDGFTAGWASSVSLERVLDIATEKAISVPPAADHNYRLNILLIRPHNRETTAAAHNSVVECESISLSLHLPEGCNFEEGLQPSWTVRDNQHLEVNIPLQSSKIPWKDLARRPTALQLSESLRCRRCKESILRSDDNGLVIQKLLPLPSEYWVELSELWMCHQEDFA